MFENSHSKVNRSKAVLRTDNIVPMDSCSKSKLFEWSVVQEQLFERTIVVQLFERPIVVDNCWNGQLL